MSRILVLGAGMVGRTIAADLSSVNTVSSADINPDNLDLIPDKYSITKIEADLANETILSGLVSDYEIIVGAVPGFMGYKTVETCIRAGKNIVDISFFPENAFDLDALAKQNNVIAIVDCGVAPGISNLLLGYHNKMMKVSDFKCYVGGLPFKREFPFEYKAPFSPIDVIEGYTRPARYVENGNLITKPALSDAEYLEFDEIGTLEAFNSDGLRTILKTINVPNMIEKTLRYPGHIEYIKMLKKSGFLNEDEILINGTPVKPIDFTSNLLFNEWLLRDADDEFTIMRIIIEGREKGSFVSYTYDLFDRRDKLTGFSSMSRTTGFTACAAVELVSNGNYSRTGISPPEYLGEDKTCFDSIINYLDKRNIILKLSKQS